MDPIVHLPPDFDIVENILQDMPIQKADGSPGLLALYRLGETVKQMPDLTDLVEKYKDNLPLMNALYRDYSFLASAYLLEPCHERSARGEGYGLARDVLPRQISRPMAKCADV
jgi:indoleamine 2,3-dioxygenase